MHPASVSAILQLDYPDRLPAGPTDDRSSVLFVWNRKGQPLVQHLAAALGTVLLTHQPYHRTRYHEQATRRLC